jgi:hypothetical protein
LNERLHNNKFEIEEHRIASLLPKSMNSPLTKMLERAKPSNTRHMLKKLLQDIGYDYATQQILVEM